jgi:hypothetical protein
MPRDQNIDVVFRQLGCPRSLDSYEWALATAAHIKRGQGWQCAFLRLRFGYGVKAGPRTTLEYNCLRLWEGQVELQTALEFARRSSQSFLAGEVSVPQSFTVWQGHSPISFWPSYLADNPSFLAESPIAQAPGESPTLESLIKDANELEPAGVSGGPCFIDILSAIQWWCGWPSKPEHNDGRLGKVHVEAQLPPGNVRLIRRSVDGGAIIELEPGLPINELSVTMAWRNGPDSKEEMATIRDSNFYVPYCPTGTIAVYVFRGGELLAHFRCQDRSIIVDEEQHLAHEIAGLIARGETDRAEFKEPPRLEFEKWKPEFWTKLVRAVVSFANSKGGILVVGANDIGRAMGLSARTRELDENPRSDVGSRISQVFRKKVQDQVLNIPQMDISWCAIGSVSVLVVTVTSNPPGIITVSLEDGILVRYNSSSRPAKPSDIADMIETQRALGIPSIGTRWTSLGI